MTRLDHPLYIDLPRKKWAEKKTIGNSKVTSDNDNGIQ